MPSMNENATGRPREGERIGPLEVGVARLAEQLRVRRRHGQQPVGGVDADRARARQREARAVADADLEVGRRLEHLVGRAEEIQVVHAGYATHRDHGTSCGRRAARATRRSDARARRRRDAEHRGDAAAGDGRPGRARVPRRAPPRRRHGGLPAGRRPTAGASRRPSTSASSWWRTRPRTSGTCGSRSTDKPLRLGHAPRRRPEPHRRRRVPPRAGEPRRRGARPRALLHGEGQPLDPLRAGRLAAGACRPRSSRRTSSAPRLARRLLGPRRRRRAPRRAARWPRRAAPRRGARAADGRDVRVLLAARLRHGRHDPHDAQPRRRASPSDHDVEVVSLRAPPRRAVLRVPRGRARSRARRRPARRPRRRGRARSALPEPAGPSRRLRLPVVQPVDRRRARAARCARCAAACSSPRARRSTCSPRALAAPGVDDGRRRST